MVVVVVMVVVTVVAKEVATNVVKQPINLINAHLQVEKEVEELLVLINLEAIILQIEVLVVVVVVVITLIRRVVMFVANLDIFLEIVPKIPEETVVAEEIEYKKLKFVSNVDKKVILSRIVLKVAVIQVNIETDEKSKAIL